MKITTRTTLLELGCLVCHELNKAGINAFLSGGAVVTIYSENEYQSYDLDFISHGNFNKITEVMLRLGFSREKGRHFIHPRSKFFVEFPGIAASVGDEPITEFGEIRTKAGTLKLLTPTHCVMDRLSAYYHWKDEQGLEQAILVANAKPISIEQIREWSKREGKTDHFKEFERRLTQSRSPTPRKSERKSDTHKIHPWRLCPAGEHWVVTHSMKTRPSKKNPTGTVTSRHAHCAHNPSGKDQLYPEEILEIAKAHFEKVKGKPCPIILKFGKNGNAFDDFIAGWVQYWNEVLQPKEPMDPNLFKALIASESGFGPKSLANKKNGNSARGLTQITNDTRKILGDEKGELKDHFVTVTRDELNDPNVNICAGVRWLFQKKLLLSNKLGRPASWEEAVEEYKGIAVDLKKGQKRAKEIMSIFEGYLEKYTKCGKP